MTGQRRQPDKGRNFQLFAAVVGWFATAAWGAEPQVTEGLVNAPVAEVWNLFTTSDGYLATGVAHP